MSFYCKPDTTEEYYSVVEDFLSELWAGIIKQVGLYDKFGSDYAYLYSERRLESLIIPTLSNMCKGAISVEVSVVRKSSRQEYFKDDARGRVDFWCLYKGYSFLIELKHSWDNYATDTTRKEKLVMRWDELIGQLDSLKADVVRGCCQEESKGIIKLALHFITSYKPHIDEFSRAEVNQYRKQLPELCVRIIDDINPKRRNRNSPDFVSSWKIPYKYVDNSFDGSLYPGLILLAKAFTPIKKNK